MTFKKSFLFLSLLLTVCFIGAGCEDSGGGGRYGENHDFGPNDPNLYLAFGDSMTAGAYDVTPYPANLEQMLGKRVINKGIGGERVAHGAGRIGAVLDQYKPGYVLITHGINDVETMSVDHILENLNIMVQAAKDRQVLPAIATLTPWVGWREWLNPAVYEVNQRIRELAASENILLVDGEPIVEGRFDYVLDDALHFNEAGSVAIAAEWADRLM